MRFFNRRPAAVDPNTTTTTGAPVVSDKHHRRHNASYGHASGSSLNARPTFGEWFKSTSLDLITMLVLGAIGLGVYFADPAPSRSFPILFRDGEIVYPEFAYPLRKEIVPIWAAAMLGVFVPIFFFCLMQIRIRSFWDLNNATIGLFYSLITAAVFQVFVKWLIGGLRPHFLTVCAPDPAAVQGGGVGYSRVMFDRSVCTGDKKQINDSLESMPSGHSTAAFAGFIFLYLYLNAKLKVWSNYHPAMWKLVVVYAPVLAACLIAGALTIDEFHNWYDCLAGAVIGTFMAFSAYRMVYASVWDFRFNHIPLSRNHPFTYSDGQAEFNGFRNSIWTRKAGWGDLEQGIATGAPFDATSRLTGGGGGGGGGGGFGSGGVSRRPVGDTTTGVHHHGNGHAQLV